MRAKETEWHVSRNIRSLEMSFLYVCVCLCMCVCVCVCVCVRFVTIATFYISETEPKQDRRKSKHFFIQQSYVFYVEVKNTHIVCVTPAWTWTGVVDWYILVCACVCVDTPLVCDFHNSVTDAGMQAGVYPWEKASGTLCEGERVRERDKERSEEHTSELQSR